ncbi:hypothetical protein ASZ90_006402 [hydrocarbon metagenome]|uniref:Uncharacterized protein n=1 Tax=hydrocarbon metagenome TaxID=938273 RepID=A0A0W8FSV3_9ZZZZ
MKKIYSFISLSFTLLFLLLNPVYVYPEAMEPQQGTQPLVFISAKPDSTVWEYYWKNLYYNKKNITRSSNIVSVWSYQIVSDAGKKEMIDNVKEFYNQAASLKYQNYDHNLYLDEIDCKKKLTRLKEIKHCDDKGNVLNSHKFSNNKEWKSIPRETILEVLYNKVCVKPDKPLKKK